MLKDNFFSMSRFMNLCRKDMVESWKVNLLRFIMMYGLMAVLFVWRGYFTYKWGTDSYDPMIKFVLYTFLWVGAICACISASFNMEKMKSKTSRLAVLMVPATPFEKFFSRWLVSTVVYILAFLIAFKLADYTRVLVCSLIFPDAKIVVAKLQYLFLTSGDYSVWMNMPVEMKRMLVINLFFFQSCFILGSSIWPKNSFLKTFAAGLFIMIVYAIVTTFFVKVIFGQTYISDNMLPSVFKENMIYVPYITGIFFIILNWTLAYFRFKEAEIINRL